MLVPTKSTTALTRFDSTRSVIGWADGHGTFFTLSRRQDNRGKHGFTTDPQSSHDAVQKFGGCTDNSALFQYVTTPGNRDYSHQRKQNKSGPRVFLENLCGLRRGSVQYHQVHRWDFIVLIFSSKLPHPMRVPLCDTLVIWSAPRWLSRACLLRRPFGARISIWHQPPV